MEGSIGADMMHLSGIADEFCIEGRVLDISPTGNGHINDTYRVLTDRNEYILQRINTDVFSDPDALMENVTGVTGHIGGKLSYIRCRDGSLYFSNENRNGPSCRSIENRSGPSCCSYETMDGSPYYGYGILDVNGCWRMMTCIRNSYSCEKASDPGIMREIGRAYGDFISAMADYPADKLHETIPGFHDTRRRYNDLLRAAELDPSDRVSGAEKELRFALERSRYADLLGGLVRSGELPLRVTHNDTKINNVMLDSSTHKAVCVIDLDTVMPGLAVTDFGDAVRSGASTGREDDEDISRIHLDMELYRSLERGFTEGFPEMTGPERELMPAGAAVMTYECGIRFLTDYLDGDRYFRTDYPEHNLVRCRAQFRLLEDMESKLPLPPQ